MLELVARVRAYVLDADGRVDAYPGEAGRVRLEQVDLFAVRDFLAGAALPLRATDPMGSGVRRVFSAAMFSARSGDVRPPGSRAKWGNSTVSGLSHGGMS